MVVVARPTMYDPKGDDPVKLRRFALTLAAILFAFALVGLQVRPEVQYLGVPFIVRRPHLLPLALIGVAVWAMIRFWYYAMVLNVSPIRARRELRKGNLPDGQRVSAPDPEGRSSVVDAALGRYYPSPVGESFVEYEMQSSSKPWTFAIKHIPLRNKLLAFGESVDYTAPLWLTALAVGAVIISARWPLG